ncbi:MAG: tRNA (N6-threonylcarbamoyladenosine(37)-N6)-methyltransferase TrmO [Dehalococcoidia bacterium]
MSEMTLKPVGFVRSTTTEPSLVARSGDLCWEGEVSPDSDPLAGVSEIIIDPEYDGLLDGVEDFSHLLILYWAHQAAPHGRTMTRAHPMGRQDLPLVGIFATCSPARPNPLCVIAVRLVERDGCTLRVEGLDAIDGSPVIDIKPYLPFYYSVPEANLSGWMNQIIEEMGGGDTAR